MPRENTTGKPTTRRYTPDEKSQAVRLVRELRKELGTDKGTVKRVADQLGYGSESVRNWVAQAEIEEGGRPETTAGDAAEIKALKQGGQRATPR